MKKNTAQEVINCFMAVILSLLISGCSSASKKQINENVEPIVFGTVKNRGYIVGVNAGDLHYFFLIQSEYLKCTGGKDNYYNFYLDNNRKIDLINLKIDFLKRKDGSEATEFDILNYYLKMEMDYNLKTYGENIKFGNSRIDRNSIKGLYWKFDRPVKDKNIPPKHMGLTIVKNRNNIISFVAATDEKGEDAYLRLLINIAITATTVNTTITKESLKIIAESME